MPPFIATDEETEALAMYMADIMGMETYLETSSDIDNLDGFNPSEQNEIRQGAKLFQKSWFLRMLIIIVNKINPK